MPPPPPSYGGYPAQPDPAQPYAPQPYAGQPTYGGFWIRFVAIFIDGLIVAIPIIILSVIVFIAVGAGSGAAGANQQTTNAAANGTSAILNLVSFLISAGYFVYFWSTGQTLAMRLFRLRVVDANTGLPIGLGRAVVRYLGYFISVLVCYIGLIWAAFDSRKQGWHDKIANTVVLQG